jgi:lipopolysaccharide transport system permease protein
MSQGATATHVRIRPPARWSGIGAQELWQHRELAYFLAKRDLQVRYKQTALGALWALGQPLALTGIFALVMGRVVDIPTGGIPYYLIALSGVTVWMFVANAISAGATSLVSDANLLSKVYFPRMLLPLTKVGALSVDLLISMTLLIVVAVATGHLAGVQILALPFFLAIALLGSVAIAILGSALNVRYRDVAALLPLGILVGLFITPVAYPASLVGGGMWAPIYAINPFATAITGVRWAVLGSPAPSLTSIAISLAGIGILLVLGVIAFRRNEAHVADLI